MSQMPPKTCPICKKPPAEKYRPFCSARCADIDLGRWITESYAVPTNEDPETDGDNEVEDD